MHRSRQGGLVSDSNRLPNPPRIPPQMRIRRPTPQLKRRQPLEVVTDIQLICHAHAAVDLYGLLADEASGLADGNLGGG